MISFSPVLLFSSSEHLDGVYDAINCSYEAAKNTWLHASSLTYLLRANSAQDFYDILQTFLYLTGLQPVDYVLSSYVFTITQSDTRFLLIRDKVRPPGTNRTSSFF
ncbi:Hypothetical_protein [Hexamita inflata]|uniref:Hypothetical_protein n=1 Tax=Hexamita inflata TaxID=28002 RepID=A0AA86PBC5_9EUKA|nr:Hypothetical protein HINF_LOCUS22271 [Hexamita inflata]